jgi:hypothetical protein
MAYRYRKNPEGHRGKALLRGRRVLSESVAYRVTLESVRRLNGELSALRAPHEPAS